VRALKAMRLKAREEWDDFRNEILIMKRIKRHRNICHILDTAEDMKFGYIVMQACS
jgi:serine/threonine protein kinase